MCLHQSAGDITISAHLAESTLCNYARGKPGPEQSPREFPCFLGGQIGIMETVVSVGLSTSTTFLDDSRKGVMGKSRNQKPEFD
ncbi:MAG: hypothetical protein U5K35_15505 [Rhodohalobacter sp.]|nr:hypothetical protein [Rhodohalobacter sp.]